MKKIIAIIITLLSFGAMADAQIQITHKSNTKTLTSVRLGFISMLRNSGYFYLVFQTNSQFDDSMIIQLGKDKKESIETLQSLIDIIASMKKGDSVTINNLGQEFRLYRYAKNSITIHADGFAGNSNTNKNEMEFFLDHLMFEVY